jgi:alkylation response protein AidB-like acyl-CoA dehydrogenase
MASNFIYSNRDLKFIIGEWLDADTLFSFDKFRDYYSHDDIDIILDQALKIVTEQVAPTNEEGDTIQARFEDGAVTVPSSFHAVYRFLNQEGWGISNLLEDEEGTLPQVLYSGIIEMITAGNPAFIPYLNLSGGVLELIQSFGSKWDKETFLPPLCAGEWSGTMCLTEAGGGSDVGDILSRAYPTDEPGIYKIKGSKVFITAGDHDICSNIIHMVLARAEGGLPGTKGLSLFIVPKIWVNPDGSLGENNDVVTVGIEHKMGIRGSATATLNFGENDNCRGILIGDPPIEGKGEGMAQMFQMMNGARMDTGMAGYTLAAQAYFNAAEYARNRVQGRAYNDPKGSRVPIIKHADIRRILLNLKACTEGMRAMAFRTYYYFDISRHSPREEERQIARDRIEVMTPLVKAYNTDMVWPLVGDAIQLYGGYGFSEEYPLAQIARDCKIYSLWEGTNYIQSMDLVGRKWNLKQGQLFLDWLQDIETIIKTMAVQYQSMDIDIRKGNLSGILQTREYHSGYPEENYIATGNQYTGRIKSLQITGFLRPSQGGKRPQGTAEPGIQHIFILTQFIGIAVGTASRVSLAADNLAALIAVPYRYAMSPPKLTRNAPVADVFHPV